MTRPKTHQHRIMFVCLGNICRSPLAHAVMAHLVSQKGLSDQCIIESSGTDAFHNGDPADPRMRETAAQHGIGIDHRSRQFRQKDLTEYDLILAMDNQNLRDILSLAQTDAQRNKIHLFREFDPSSPTDTDVPDPYYGGQQGFDEVFTIVERTCHALLEHLTSVPDKMDTPP